ncbi:hypothetical protein [Arenibaculum pallidiluteum]|uniref:hypothetical protein n=1 Tax=Arenibaculum pallidiluteum TaxID=2812559 RepID=UPI001A973D3B|nr:hypothetical protein [Arenibaculum pallidiluteum]
MRYDVLLVDRVDGEPIAIRNMRPYLVIYPLDAHFELRNDQYFARSVWQVVSIRVK